MRRLSAHTLLLFALIIMASIAAMPATLAKPNAPTTQATSNPGELTITWERIPGAQYYTVGWINWTQGRPVHEAGGDWLSLFHYSTVPGGETGYTVTGLTGGQNHHAIIRATDVSSGRFGGDYSAWSAWSPAVQPASPPPPSAPGDSSFLTPPASSGNCSEGQRLHPGQACVWPPGNFTVFAINGGDYHNWAVLHDGGSIRLLQGRATGQHVGDRTLRIQKQGNVWVITEVS